MEWFLHSQGWTNPSYPFIRPFIGSRGPPCRVVFFLWLENVPKFKRVVRTSLLKLDCQSSRSRHKAQGLLFNDKTHQTFTKWNNENTLKVISRYMCKYIYIYIYISIYQNSEQSQSFFWAENACLCQANTLPTRILVRKWAERTTCHHGPSLCWGVKKMLRYLSLGVPGSAK